MGLHGIDIEGAGRELTTIIPTGTSASIISAGGYGDLTDIYSRVAHLTIDPTTDRGYGTPLLDFSLTRNLLLEDINVILDPHIATFLRLHGAYQLRSRGVVVRAGKYGLPLEFLNDVNLPSTGGKPQCDTSWFDFQVDGCQVAIFRDTSNEVHNFNFVGKCVQTTFYATAPADNTTLNGAHSAAATSLTVIAGTGIVVGDVLTIDPGFSVCEQVKVAGISGTTVTLDANTPLQFAHASGAEVFRGGVPFSFGSGYNNMVWHSYHFEGQQIGVAANAVHGLVFHTPYKGCGRLVHVCDATTAVQVWSPIMIGTVNKNELLRRSSNNASSNDGDWFCSRPFVPSGASLTPAIPADYFPHNTKSWQLQAANTPDSPIHYRNADSSKAGTKAETIRSGGTEKEFITYGNGSAVRGRLAKTADYVVLATDPEYIGLDPTSNTIAITLPAANTVVAGKAYTFKDEGLAAATHSITVSRSSTDTIKDATSVTSITMSTNGQTVRLYSDGSSKWFVV